MVAMEHRYDDAVKAADFGQRRYSIHRKGAKGAKSKQGKRNQTGKDVFTAEGGEGAEKSIRKKSAFDLAG